MRKNRIPTSVDKKELCGLVSILTLNFKEVAIGQILVAKLTEPLTEHTSRQISSAMFGEKVLL